ncbi:MAG: MBL fold metallo-hydrolase, partial [Anaerolineae bacterium]|nr:MBL fold metallo-hydrolase [Anaerolineae bacterium]
MRYNDGVTSQHRNIARFGGYSVEINWYGHACFRLKDRNITVVCDPYDK